MKTATLEAKPEAKKHFVNLTPGKLTGLRSITDKANRFKVLALDQSNSFKKALRAMHEKQGAKQEPPYEEIRDTKLEMVSTLGTEASAVLLDINFGARQALNSFALPKGVGLIIRLEASKDAGLPGDYEPGWSVAQIKKMGASAVKLLVYLDTEDPANVQAQMRFVEEVSKDCAKEDILLMTEELSFPRKGEEKTSPSYLARKVKNILEATKLIGPWTDILKLEFPGDRTMPESQQEENLGRLNEAALRPWVLLSAGEKYDIFVKFAERAMKSGASGYMAGRAIFNEYFEGATPQDRAKFLKTTGLERMRELNGLVDGHATPWTQRYVIGPKDLAQAVSPDWYLGGSQATRPQPTVKGDY